VIIRELINCQKIKFNVRRAHFIYTLLHRLDDDLISFEGVRFKKLILKSFYFIKYVIILFLFRDSQHARKAFFFSDFKKYFLCFQFFIFQKLLSRKLILQWKPFRLLKSHCSFVCLISPDNRNSLLGLIVYVII